MKAFFEDFSKQLFEKSYDFSTPPLEDHLFEWIINPIEALLNQKVRILEWSINHTLDFTGRLSCTMVHFFNESGRFLPWKINRHKGTFFVVQIFLKTLKVALSQPFEQAMVVLQYWINENRNMFWHNDSM